MPKNTSRIGKADERMIVKDLEALGYRARRQPGSGNRAVDLQHDVVFLDSPAGKLHIEGKYRKDCAWKTIEAWRSGADILCLRCDARQSGQEGQRMAYLPWSLLLRLIGDAATRAELCDLEAIPSQPAPPIDRTAIEAAYKAPAKRAAKPRSGWPPKGSRKLNRKPGG
jgi:hypothetical protein